MTITKPVNSGYSVILGSTTGSNGSKVDTWLEYKVLSQSIELNQSTVRVILYSQATFDSSTAHTVTRQFGYVKIDSNQQDYTMTGGYDFDNYKLNKFADYTFTVSHNSNGTKTVAMSGAWSDSGWSSFINGGSASASVTLPTIPQYASCTISNTSKTETSAVIKWTTDQTVDHVWYSTNGGTSYTDGGSVNATTGTINLTGLSANTTYSIKVKVRNKSSQLQSESSALSVKTYNYPYATTMPNFSIGDKVALEFYNPLGRTFTMYVILNGVQISDTWELSGVGYTGLHSSTVVQHLYACIPSSKSATYQIKCVYNDGTSHTVTKTGGTASAKESDVKPTIGTFTYQDTNSTAYAITGDRSKIVQNISTVGYTASTLSAKQSATLSSAKVTVNGQTINLTLSGSSATGGNAVINSGTDVTATVTVTDSRGFTATKNVTIDMVEYSNPSAIITVERHNNYYSETDITVDADYVSIGSNAITIQYRTKKTGGSYGSWGNLSDNVTSTVSLDNEFAWDIQIKLTDSFGGTTTYNTSISRGMPIVFFDRLRESMGVNCFPSADQSLFVNGYDMLNSLTYKGILDSTVDIDDMHGAEYTGYYAIRSSMPTNYPNSGWTWCYFIVLSNGDVSQQYVFRPSTGFIARHWAGNPPHWYVWHYITTTHFAIGDTFTFNVSFPLNGFITSSTTGVRLALYLPKSASQVPVVKVTECSGTLRGISGYLNSNSSNYDFISDSTNYTVIATKVKDNLITLQINKSSAYTNVTNNTPVSFYPNKLTLSFEDSE
jgi:hypothetical protein